MTMVLSCMVLSNLYDYPPLTTSSRYLRARKFVPLEAFAQFKDTEIWRKDNDLDALYEKIDIRQYWEARSVVSC